MTMTRVFFKIGTTIVAAPRGAVAYLQGKSLDKSAWIYDREQALQASRDGDGIIIWPDVQTPKVVVRPGPVSI